MKKDDSDKFGVEGWEVEELAALGTDHAARAEARQRIEALPPAERDRLLELMSEADQVREELERVELPAGLEGKLLRIADEPEVRREEGWTIRRVLATKVTWRPVAACLLVGLLVLAVMSWPVTPPGERPLDGRIAAKLMAMAVKYHEGEEGKRLDFASEDVAKVREAMSKYDLPFEPQVLKTLGEIRLLGEGVADFGETRAVFTRWEGTAEGGGGAGQARYTLYQLDGRPFGVPEEFLTMVLKPEGASTRRVEIWAAPDGLCTWVLVADNGDGVSPFVHYGY